MNWRNTPFPGSLHFPEHGWFLILKKDEYLDFERNYTRAALAAWVEDADNIQALLDKRWEAFGLWLTKDNH